MKRLLLLASLHLLRSATVSAAPPRYEIEGIEVDGRTVSSIHLNNNGEVAFSVFPEEPEDGPFLPGEAILVRQSNQESLGDFGGASVVSTHINNSSHVVGYTESESGASVSFLYENGELTSLVVPGSSGSAATAINDEGVIVGRATYAGNVSRAYRRTPDGIYKPLITLGGNQAIATDINNQGTIVGASRTQTDDFFIAFSFENNEIYNLGTLGGNSSQASSINEQSKIIGVSALPNGIQHAVLFEREGVPVDLAPNWMQSGASDINGANQVVGFVTDTPDQDFQAAMFNLTGEQPLLLENLIPKNSGWETLNIASSINDRGQIVGRGVFNGESTIFLLTPIPEPSTLFLLAYGLLATYRWQNRKVHCEIT